MMKKRIIAVLLLFILGVSGSIGIQKIDNLAEDPGTGGMVMQTSTSDPGTGGM
jgi:uncharacterized membrane protein